MAKLKFFIITLTVILGLSFGLTLALKPSLIARAMAKLGQSLQALSSQLNSEQALISPFIAQQEKKELPLAKYSYLRLKTYPYQASQVSVDQFLSETEQQHSFTFSYLTTQKKMTGVLSLPKETPPNQALPVLILLRGYVPQASYSPGVGTQNAAKFFSSQGYATLSLDFFGFGQSDSEPENSWEARFIKPINVIELILSLQKNPNLEINLKELQTAHKLNPARIGLWAHSNGGQIALSVLEITSQPLPTTLWAPVTVPFPYSILFFSDEHEDEGQKMRAWLALFEKDYNVLDYSLTQHLDLLAGSINLHHGTADEAALTTWSDEFVQKIEQENDRRLDHQRQQQKTATISGQPAFDLIEMTKPKKPIELNYYTYPGADHNLQPQQHWNQAIERDLVFFQEKL